MFVETNRNHSAIRGITLVEVLAVIVILSILMALTFSVGSPLRQAAREVQAKNNLKQLHLAHLLYQMDQPGHQESGTATEMGLPEILFWTQSDMNKNIIGRADQWVSPCGDHPASPNEIETGRSLQTWLSDRPTWKQHTTKMGPNSVMLMDQDCNPHNVNIKNLLVKSKNYVIRFHGGISITRTYGQAIDLRDHENE